MFKLFIANLKIITRNRQALFWIFMFPLMFTVIFGLFFGKNSTNGTIGIINKSDSKIAESLIQTLKDANLFKIADEENLDSAKTKLQKNSESAVIIIPDSFGSQAPGADNQIKIIYDQGNAQIGTIVTNFVDKFLTQLDFQLAHAQPVYSVAVEKLSDRELTYFDFVLAGILGLALMNSSIVQIAVNMTKYREDKILKRITMTPIKSWWFVSAEVLARLILNFFQIGLVLIIGKYLFDAHIYGNIFIIFGVSIVGALLFQSMGFVVASFAKNTDAAQGMAMVIAIPMMFLAGVFFPIDSLPKWLYTFVQYLPLAPLLRIIRGVTLEGLSPFNDMRNVLIILGWIIICLTVSMYRFKLSEE